MFIHIVLLIFNDFDSRSFDRCIVYVKVKRDVQNSWGSEASKANLLRLIKDCCSMSCMLLYCRAGGSKWSWGGFC